MDSSFDILRGKLSHFVPEAAAPLLADWIIRENVKIRVAKERKTRTGDYRPPQNGHGHRITVNMDLSPYEFLITLVHEFAHMRVTKRYYTNGFFRKRVDPHGKEWKAEFRSLMEVFIKLSVFPGEILTALQNYLNDPAASSCSDLPLQRVLKRHNSSRSHLVHLEELPEGSSFQLPDGRIFIKQEKMRKNFRCVSVPGGRAYIVSPVAEVMPVSSQEDAA
jgi:SprT protein